MCNSYLLKVIVCYFKILGDYSVLGWDVDIVIVDIGIVLYCQFSVYWVFVDVMVNFVCEGVVVDDCDGYGIYIVGVFVNLSCDSIYGSIVKDFWFFFVKVFGVDGCGCIFDVLCVFNWIFFNSECYYGIEIVNLSFGKLIEEFVQYDFFVQMVE